MRYQIRSALVAIAAGMLLGSSAAFAASTACTASDACKADLNGNGVVNFADLAIMKSCFFQPASSCTTCGDGVAQGPTEECDDGNLLSDDGCSKSCTIEGPLPLVCGDWISVEPEQCDDGNLVNGDGCSSTCQIEVPVAISRFEDRGFTVFDHQTGLEWEKTTDDGGWHDKDNRYTWSTGTPWGPNGTAFTVFLYNLNAGIWFGKEDGPECFAGHCGWRLPSVGELETIVDCSYGVPCVAPIFGPTQSDGYSSSSSYWHDLGSAWFVEFSYGHAYASGKSYNHYVRAVRGGL